MNATTIEQSNRLIDIGIDADMADMCWILPPLSKYDEDIFLCAMPYRNWRHDSAVKAPAFTLSKLLSMMPHEINLHRFILERTNGRWVASYRYNGVPLNGVMCINEEPIEAVVQLMEYVVL